jgi:hypothetical protein
MCPQGRAAVAAGLTEKLKLNTFYNIIFIKVFLIVSR